MQHLWLIQAPAEGFGNTPDITEIEETGGTLVWASDDNTEAVIVAAPEGAYDALCRLAAEYETEPPRHPSDGVWTSNGEPVVILDGRLLAHWRDGWPYTDHDAVERAARQLANWDGEGDPMDALHATGHVF